MEGKDFIMTVEANFTRPILRQSLEGVAIARTIKARDNGDRVILVNSKREFVQPGVVRPVFSPLVGS